MSQVAGSAVLTLEEAAAYLRVPAETLARQAEQGRIPGRQVDAEWRFLQSALVDWLGSRDGRRALLRGRTAVSLSWTGRTGSPPRDRTCARG